MVLILTISNLQRSAISLGTNDDLDRPTLKLQLTTSMKELFKDTQCHTVKEVVAALEAKRGCLDLLGEVD